MGTLHKLPLAGWDLEEESFSEDLISDLLRLQDTLKETASHGARFCLPLRDGFYASGFEMDRRKGSFF